MSSGLLNISVTGLNAAQSGLLTTSHNIANASTTGYNRQAIVQNTNTGMFTGSGYIGQGTSVINVKRVYDAFLGNQVLGAQTAASQLEAYSSQIGQISNLLGDASTGLSPVVQSYFSALSMAAANPSSLAVRQSVLSSAQSLTGQFQTLNDQLAQARNGVNSQIRTEVVTINSLAAQIAEINQQIVEVPRGTSQQQPNDLLDQRDQLISDLNKEIRVSTHLESDGSLSVFFGTGQPLVVGARNMQLVALPDQEDVTNLQVGLSASGSGAILIPESLINGGKLGGLLNYRSQTLDSAQNGLGRIALALAASLNAQHQLGQDLNGNLGGDLFKPIALGVVPASLNTGNAVLAANVTVSDYQITFSGGAYNITRQSDGSNLGAFASLPQMVDGVKISLLGGVPANGDSFIVTPSAQSGRRVAALTNNTGTATLDSSGSNLQTLTDSDYRLTLTAPNNFSLTRLSDNQIWTGTGASQAAALSDVMLQADAQGFSLGMASGAMAVGDAFLIRPTRNAASELSLAISDPRLLALGTPLRTGAASANAGTAAISAGVVADSMNLPSSTLTLTYQVPGVLQGFPSPGSVTVTPPGGQPTRYTITLPTDTVPFSSGAEVSFNGISFSISGKPVDGDIFTISPNPAGVADSRNAVLLGNLQTANTLLGGSGNYQSIYAQMVAEVGNKAREINVRLDAQNKLVQQGQDAIQSNSGVNLDEEAANLMRYQQAYQASAKIMSIADKLFSQILQLGQ